jgi:hypothetical protein
MNKKQKSESIENIISLKLLNKITKNSKCKFLDEVKTKNERHRLSCKICLILVYILRNFSLTNALKCLKIEDKLDLDVLNKLMLAFLDESAPNRKRGELKLSEFKEVVKSALRSVKVHFFLHFLFNRMTLKIQSQR